ncbi:MAG: OmpP1/FadL family transporter [Ekhidna sp.]
MKKLTLILSLVCYSVISNGQTGPFGYYQDALLYGQSNYSLGSTARMQAIGGAQVALGGDISSAASNPAGLGFFTKSIFSFTPSLNFNSVNTSYSTFEGDGDVTFHDPNETFKNNFNFSNLGTVINFETSPYASDKFKGGSMAISLSRMNNFNLRRDYEGFNNTNSVLDQILADSEGQTIDEISELAYAAFDQYLINEEPDGLSYTSNVGGFPVQRERIKESGSHYQLNVAYGGNYDDRLYFGGGMGVQILNYRQNKVFSESDFLQGENDLDSLNSLTIENDLSVRGSGVNFNFGVIARPIDIMTIGISYTSPTFFSLDEEGFLDLNTEWDQGATGLNNGQGVDLASINSYQSDLFVSNFRMRSPAKLAVGTALFLGKNGFITGDLEFVNFRSATINSNDFSPTADNREIEAIYANVMNIRLGGEFRIDNFRLRGGYALFPSPYKNSNLEDRENITFGIGYRNSDYYLDLAVVNGIRNTTYAPYTIAENQPIATSEIKNTSVALTLGFNF